jgi:hypothetical protein
MELPSMVNLRLARGPLPREENQQILSEYNRLTGARIPIHEFEHWVQRGPAGPAWHAILETDERRIVGHTSLIPLRTAYGPPGLIPAKSEYSFVNEEFRSAKIRGFEKGRIKFLVLVDELFKHCQGIGWGPYFVSTREANHALSRRVGCKAAEFPLWECILVRKPWIAARETPNLGAKERAGLFAIGLAQQVPWNFMRLVSNGSGKIRTVAIASGALEPTMEQLSLFEDLESLRWRYFEDQYLRLNFDRAPGDYVIAKRGSPDRFLRVCQWRLKTAESARELFGVLVRETEKDNAMGVRWAVYGDDAISAELVKGMRRLGFVCQRRVRTLMLHSKVPEFQEAANWNVNDSLVSFDP